MHLMIFKLQKACATVVVNICSRLFEMDVIVLLNRFLIASLYRVYHNRSMYCHAKTDHKVYSSMTKEKQFHENCFSNSLLNSWIIGLKVSTCKTLAKSDLYITAKNFCLTEPKYSKMPVFEWPFSKTLSKVRKARSTLKDAQFCQVRFSKGTYFLFFKK